MDLFNKTTKGLSLVLITAFLLSAAAVTVGATTVNPTTGTPTAGTLTTPATTTATTTTTPATGTVTTPTTTATTTPAAAEVKKMTLSRTGTVTLWVGEKLTLKAENAPAKVKWKSSKKSIATVTSKGKVTAKKKGTATITATSGKEKATVKLQVKNPYLNFSKLTLEAGKTQQLALTGTRIKSAKSSKKSVAKVSAKALITAVKKGSATISVKGKNNKTYKCKVTVTASAADQIKFEGNTGGIPQYTGNAKLDYLAEQYCKDAGITMSMTEEEKLKRIYHYIAKNFNHVDTKDTSSAPKYLDYNAKAAEIEAYRKECAAKVAAGQARYVHLNYSLYLVDAYSVYQGDKHMKYQDTVFRFMNARIGTCVRQSDAFNVMANHVGVKAGPVAGGTNHDSHHWNFAYIGNTMYFYDPDHQCRDGRKDGYDVGYYKATAATCKPNLKYANTKILQ